MYSRPQSETDGDAAAKRLKAMTRIRKLLRLAEDQADCPEGRAAKNKAESLMAEHGLQRSSMDLGSGYQTDFRHRAFEIGASEAWRRARSQPVTAPTSTPPL